MRPAAAMLRGACVHTQRVLWRPAAGDFLVSVMGPKLVPSTTHNNTTPANAATERPELTETETCLSLCVSQVAACQLIAAKEYVHRSSTGWHPA